jgi:iron complex outermembrane receptor protein
VFDYVVGGFYDHNESPSFLTSETPILANLTTVNTINLASIIRGAETTEKSAFANLTAHLGKFELSGGLRYIDYKAFGSLIQNGARPVPDTNDHENATIYSLSAKYQINPNLMVYASTGTSWRIGMRAVGNFSTTRTARETMFMDLPPEKSQSYEIGAKFTFLDGRGRFNISAYHQDFKNYPYRGGSIFFINRAAGAAVDNVAAFNFLAAVPVKVDGVEAEASFQITDRWSIAANASYAHGRIRNGTIACNDLNADGIPDINATTPTTAQLQTAVGAGQHVAQCTGINQTASFTPRFSANVQSEYGFALGSKADAFVRGLATIYGNNDADPSTNFDDTSAYALLNLYAGIRDPDGAWELTLFGKNILNTNKVLPSGNTASGNPPTGTLLSNSLRVGAGTSTYISNYYEIGMTPPREFGVNLRIALGSR